MILGDEWVGRSDCRSLPTLRVCVGDCENGGPRGLPRHWQRRVGRAIEPPPALRSCRRTGVATAPGSASSVSVRAQSSYRPDLMRPVLGHSWHVATTPHATFQPRAFAVVGCRSRRLAWEREIVLALLDLVRNVQQGNTKKASGLPPDSGVLPRRGGEARTSCWEDLFGPDASRSTTSHRGFGR